MSDTNHILVIDDEIGICEGVKRALIPTGYRVDATISSTEGLELIRKGHYSLVLLDVKMPEASGIDLIGSIHAHDPEIVCIIITGYATVEMAVSAIKQGAYDFLTKPFSVDDLNLAVNQGLERRRLSLEARRTTAAEAESRKLAEEKSRLEELDRAKKQFIRLVTHELQSPIDAIQSYLNLIRDGYVSPDQLPEIIEKCAARADEQRALIADLLELGQMETLTTQRTAALVRLEAVLREVLDSIQPRADSRKIKIILQVEPGIPPVLADPGQCRSLWLNLLDNAVKYTPENGSVTVRLRAKAGVIVGQVTDTGIGIPPEERARLFTEFFRARNARESGVRGTGLGLVIVKRIVDGLGGQVAVRSEVGRGSTFSFEIPAGMDSLEERK
ncbi:MAG: response regulator receiver [Anaerolineaceae bacterium]|nr:MAG: response regulator receiver [Anaerolineaceae bacterium]